VAGRESAEAEQRAGYRNVCLFDELDQSLRGLRFHDALRVLDQLYGALELLGERRVVGTVAGKHDLVLVPLEYAALLLRILGDVDDDRPGSA